MNDSFKGLWRLIQPIRNYGIRYPLRLWSAYYHFFVSWKKYKKMGGVLSFRYIAPYLYFKEEDVQSGGSHYFYQDIWALRHLARFKPTMHYDIGSRFDGFVGQATAICPVTCIDIRPPSFRLPSFYFVRGDILKLPFKDEELNSLSCLHTIEHIGLGRYGDDINPDGFNQALLEMQRVLTSGAHLLLSMPIGIERIEFNAQRVLNPTSCIEILQKMKLVEFSVVTEQNEYIEHASPQSYSNSKYCCGLFLFKKV